MRYKIFDFLYSIFLKVIGRNIYPRLAEKREFEMCTHDEVRQRQFNKLKGILVNAYNNVPFYKNRFDELNFDPNDLKTLEAFSKLDFYIEKDDIKKDPDAFISKACSRSNLSWHRTGGSTGTPLYFATDRQTDSGSLTSIMRSLNWFGTKFGRKHVIFWGSPTFVIRTPMDRVRKIGVTARNYLMNRRFISNYDLNPDNMQQHYEMIENFQPEYIRGMASSLYIFSKFLVEKDLKFHKSKPKVIQSACEQLFDWQKVVIERAFGVPVVNTYGLSELSDIAYEAKCGHLHVSDEDVYLELIPISNDINEIVATQLNNFDCPLIRYKTGDIARNLSRSDSCGIPLTIIEGLQGRAHDFIKGENGQFIHGQFFTHLVVFEAGIEKYQIVQKSLSSLVVKLIVNSEYSATDTEIALYRGISNVLGHVNVNFEYVDKIPLTPSGKHRWIISEVHG